MGSGAWEQQESLASMLNKDGRDTEETRLQKTKRCK